MESVARRLELLQEEDALWQKHCENEKRRIEKDYQRSLTEMRKRFQKAAEAIKLEFTARKEEVKRMFSGKDASEQIITKPKSVTGSSKPFSYCTTSPPNAKSTHMPISTTQLKFISKHATDATLREVVTACDKGDENDEKEGYGLMHCSTYWQNVISSAAQRGREPHLGSDRYETFIGLEHCEFIDGKESMTAVIFIHDPGGTFMNICAHEIIRRVLEYDRSVS